MLGPLVSVRLGERRSADDLTHAAGGALQFQRSTDAERCTLGGIQEREAFQALHLLGLDGRRGRIRMVTDGQVLNFEYAELLHNYLV